jgi:hypothetical protein
VEQPERRAPAPPERRASERRASVEPEAQRPLPERRRVEPERRAVELPAVPRVPLERESPAALASRARGDVRVDVASERAGGGVTVYTVRLRERDGRAVNGAAVTIHGRRGDGEMVAVGLDPASEPGVYRVAVRAGDVTGARLRVASSGRIQDLPLPE